MRTLLAPLLLASLCAACGDDLPDLPPMGPTSTSTGLPPSDETNGFPGSSTSTGAPDDTSGGSSSSTGHSSVGIPDECTVTADCPLGELCVAPFDQSAGPEGKGPTECVTECVVIMDEDRWCADAAACCDPEAECTDRGYCVYPSDSTGATDTGASTGDTGASTGTGG